MKSTNKPGFALISTLAVLVVVSILVVAYTSTVRTERNASQNFSERERADAIGQAMVSRLLADHAAPEISGTLRLKPFAVDPKTLLPTKETTDNYFPPVKPPLPGIYAMRRQSNLSDLNGLVRISQPEAAAAPENANVAFTPYDWAYSRVKVTPGSDPQLQDAFLPKDKEGALVTPQWMDYFAPTDAESTDQVPVGEVAFAIWDESGKIDINMAGKDPTVNGMAPHDLGFDKLANQTEDSPKQLMALLDGPDGKRQRSNFSLRATTKTQENRTGDDRWLFSVDELVQRNLFKPETFKQLGTYSRDFDVRPEWDGNREGVAAERFLRSYINNPKLFELFSNSNQESRKAGPHLVKDSFNQTILENTLRTYNIPVNESWLQLMRLLVALRQTLPPFKNDLTAAGASQLPLSMNTWNDHDVWGIALNVMQAAAPASDENLFAYNRNVEVPRPYDDPNNRVGIRVAPFITETALKAERQSPTHVKVTQYIEFWNPYAVPLVEYNPANKQFQPIRYWYGNWAGNQWVPTQSGRDSGNLGGLYSMGSDPFRWSLPDPTSPDPKKRYTLPGPGEFRVVELPPLIVPWGTTVPNMEMRARPYIQNAGYYNKQETNGTEAENTSFSVSIAPFLSRTDPNSNRYSEPQWQLYFVLPTAKMVQGKAVWHSFQIDDPRMGPYNRFQPVPYQKEALTAFKYSWQARPDEHSLAGVIGEGRFINQKFGTTAAERERNGYNFNFGDNWPTGPGVPEFSLERAHATFALPQRPFLNVGELGSVFANRPWRTLSFAKTTTPLDPRVPPGTQMSEAPTALLDYLTTIGTVSSEQTLNYKPKGETQSGGIVMANKVKRLQDRIWLFEKVAKATVGEPDKPAPDGNLRPIRGRINLNSASFDTIKTLLKAPYRVVLFNGINSWYKDPVPKRVVPSDPYSDVEVTISDADAELIANEIAPKDGAVSSVRPFRSMADLSRLTSITKLHATNPDPVVDAVVGRLAQFGTVRQQIFRVDMAARALNRNVEKQRLTNPNIRRVVTAEVRFQTRLYFDTFSRKAFVESIEYR